MPYTAIYNPLMYNNHSGSNEVTRLITELLKDLRLMSLSTC